MLDITADCFIELGGVQRELYSKRPHLDDDHFAYISLKFNSKEAKEKMYPVLLDTLFAWGDMKYNAYYHGGKQVMVKPKHVDITEGSTSPIQRFGSTYHRGWKMRTTDGLISHR